MTAPFVSNIFNPDISNEGSNVNTNFFDLVNYIAQRNNGTAQWDSISIAGNTTISGTLTVTGASTFNTAITITPTTNQIILGTTRTVTLTAPTPAVTSRVHTIPDISAAGTFAFLEGTQTFSGTKTFSTAVAINPTSNQLVLGVTRTVTITAPTPASSSRTHTIPDISGDGTFAFLEGTQTFSGTKTFSVAVTITPTSNQLVLGTTRTVTLTAPTPGTTSRTHTIPDITADGTFAFLEGTQTFSGAKTFSSAITVNPTTNQIVLGVTNTTTISATAPAASRVYTIPDISGNGSFAFLEGTQTFSGTKTFSAATLTQTSSQTSAVHFKVENTGTGNGSVARISVFQTGSTAVPDALISFSVNAGANYWLVGIDNSDSEIFKIAHSSTDVSAFGSNTVLAVTDTDDVYTTTFGTYSSTITGFSGTPTQLIYYKKIGKLVWLWYYIDGTSNATTLTFTAPFSSDANNQGIVSAASAIDNGVSLTTPARVRLPANDNVILAHKDFSGAAWTNSGSKFIQGELFYQGV